MAKAIKCDRCKRCFDPCSADGEFCSFANPIFYTGGSAKENVYTRKLFESKEYLVYEVDLCPECTKLFEDFMNGAPLRDELHGYIRN